MKPNQEQLCILRGRTLMSIRQGADYDGFRIVMVDPVSNLTVEDIVKNSSSIDRSRRYLLEKLFKKVIEKGFEI